MAVQIEWEKKIQIDKEWVSRQLKHHFHERDLKVAIRGYTPRVSGTNFTCDDMVAELGYMITDYVLSEDKKASLKNDLVMKYGVDFAEKNAERHLMQMAQRFFGKKDPETDGKFGELLLFAIVESVLETKMVAHKIVNLSNFKDQSKGGDGVFLGNYQIDSERVKPAIFIGEAKIMQGFSDAVGDAMDSLKRFHSTEVRAEFNSTEFIVARDTMMADDDYEEMYKRLSPGTSEYKEQIMVHPILIMFNTAKINTFEKKCLTPDELEKMLAEYMEKSKVHFMEAVKEKIKSFPEVSKVFIDIFIFPFNDINKFRNGMYYNIHGVSFEKAKDGK